MDKSLITALLFSFLSHFVFSQDITTLYEKEKFTTIIQMAENADSSTLFSTLDLYQIGRAYLTKDNPQKALDYFQKSLSAGRDSANVYFFIGICHKELNDLDKAMTAFDKATNRDSSDQYAWAEKGLIYYMQNNLPDATKNFEKAVALPYQYDYPYFVTLNLYYLQDQNDKFIAFYEKWGKMLSESEIYQLDTWRIMGDFEKNTKKDMSQALGFYEKVLEKDGLSLKAYENVLKVLTVQENWTKVDSLFEELKKAHEAKRLNQEDLKREAAVVDATNFNDTIKVVTVRYFKKPTEFAEPIYKSFIINIPLDSTVMVLLTEKSFNLNLNDLDKKSKKRSKRKSKNDAEKSAEEETDNHMLCGWRGSAHLNFGMITRNGKVQFADYKKSIWGILENRFQPTASSTKYQPDKD
ncbi:MAG: tetratricopeptide repeat protein [Saprospiraceae bacterium]|nr:tetratricopeptide repeat protein [Saprospiraceae bacterium]